MIIFDASTLILLAKIDILKTVTEMQEILVSKEVEKEATCKPELFDAKIIAELIKEGEIRVEKNKGGVLLRKFMEDFAIAEGEASVLLLAHQKEAILATDDGQTIKACKILGIKFVTAIHFLLSVYYKKKISKELALIKLEHLKNLGRYNIRIISDAINRIEGRRKG